MMMMIIMITITIIIVLKGAILDALQSDYCAVNCLQHTNSPAKGAVCE